MPNPKPCSIIRPDREPRVSRLCKPRIWPCYVGQRGLVERFCMFPRCPVRVRSSGPSVGLNIQVGKGPGRAKRLGAGQKVALERDELIKAREDIAQALDKDGRREAQWPFWKLFGMARRVIPLFPTDPTPLFEACNVLGS